MLDMKKVHFIEKLRVDFIRTADLRFSIMFNQLKVISNLFVLVIQNKKTL